MLPWYSGKVFPFRQYLHKSKHWSGVGKISLSAGHIKAARSSSSLWLHRYLKHHDDLQLTTGNRISFASTMPQATGIGNASSSCHLDSWAAKTAPQTFVASTSDPTPARKLLAGACASHLWPRAPETDALAKLAAVSCSECLMQRIRTLLLRFVIQSLQPGLKATEAGKSGCLFRKSKQQHLKTQSPDRIHNAFSCGDSGSPFRNPGYALEYGLGIKCKRHGNSWFSLL